MKQRKWLSLLQKSTPMALIKCRHCGGTVSTKAHICPHCGNDPRNSQPENGKPHRSSGSMKRPALITLLLLAVGGGAGLYLLHGDNETRNQVATDSIGSITEDHTATDSTSVRQEEQTGTEAATKELADGIPASFVLKGEMAGFPMSVNCKLDDGHSFHGIYHNLTYGTKMPVEGSVDGQHLSFSGRVQGESFSFDLWLEETGSGKRYSGQCHSSKGSTLSVWLDIL